MTIPSSAQPTPITMPAVSRPFVDTSSGNLVTKEQIALQQLRNYIVNMSRRFPCNASTTSNVITLTLLDVAPTLTQYADFDDFGFIADTTTTNFVTALVVTPTGNLATLKVFKDNGAAQAANGDVVLGSQYWATYVDSLDSGNGGFVIR